MIKRENSYQSTLVLIATLNEEEGVGPTLNEINYFLEKPPCLIVDGKSTDDTTKIARAMGAQVIVQKDAGKGDAIATALEHLRACNFRYVAFIDADYTYPAEYLPYMIRILEENSDVGMVCGNRFNDHLHFAAMPNMFYFGNRLLALTHSLLNGVDLSDPLTGLRVVRAEIVSEWRPKSKGFDIEVELNNLIEYKGFKILEIPISYRQRLGEKKLKLRHGLTILRRIFAARLQS